MIVRTGLRWSSLCERAWRQLLFMVVYSALFVVAYERGYVGVAIPTGIATMLGTALSILLGFRINSAYGRWWEARKIWGGIVNDSRTLARQVLSLFVAASGDQASMGALQKELIRRQIGWCYALNRSLRKQDPFPALEPFLPAAELEALRSEDNRTNAILQTQGERIRDARAQGYLDAYLSLPIEATLARLTDHMGKCERIKSTIFPTPYSYILSRVVWLFFFLLPAGLVQHLGWVTVPFSVVVATMFSLIHIVSYYLQDPFENRSTDTPMDAICRTIEINLRQQLGETELPPKVQPVDGVLM